MKDRWIERGELADVLRQYVGKHNEAVMLSERQRRVLNVWLAADESHPAKWEAIKATADVDELTLQNIDAAARIWHNMEAEVYPSRRRARVYQWMAAAVVVSAIAFGYWMYQRPGADPAMAAQDLPKLPGLPSAARNDQVALTLSNGQIVYLDSATIGNIPAQGGVQVSRQGADQLVYDSRDQQEGTLHYNTITTPHGKQFALLLADGTRIWMNAGSTLRFPAQFQGRTRQVQLTGEAYFDVAHHASQPFVVSVGASHEKDMDVTVLGTRFNISAYPDDDTIRTSLLQGRVAISKGGKEQQLAPGQQGKLAHHEDNAGIQLQRGFDAEGVTSWKDGKFYFRDTDIRTVLHTIARWYGKKLVIRGDASKGLLNAELKKSTPLPTVLEFLDDAGYPVRMEGDQLIFD